MQSLLQQVVTRHSHLLSLTNSPTHLKLLHARLLKLGLNRHTFLGNTLLAAYFRLPTSLLHALRVSDDIANQNIFTHNILINGLFRFGEFKHARHVFDEMTERDVVTWNSIIKGYVTCGLNENAMRMFSEMLRLSPFSGGNVGLSERTFSIVMSAVTSCGYRAREIHGNVIVRGLSLWNNVVVGNSLVGMYARVGLAGHAFRVFLCMDKKDVVSWNSLIWGFSKSGFYEMALDQFFIMRSADYCCVPDEFTVSTVINVCSGVLDLGRGKQIVGFSFKTGLLFCNSIVSSAAIDMFSKCNSLVDAVRMFEELRWWDIAVFNSMISSYAREGCVENSMLLFAVTLRKNLRPTEFTLSSVLSCTASFVPVELGIQIHSLVIKLGFESDAIVASSLVDFYTKLGLIDNAVKIFSSMLVKDLISWNTIIKGLARNGKLFETLDTFKELVNEGMPADDVTLAGVLLACKLGRFVDEAMSIFISMENEYRIKPAEEHYVSIVDLLTRAGKLEAAIDIVEAMPYEPSYMIWESILRACALQPDIRRTERVAQLMMKLEPQSSLPYLVLARSYEMRGRWESMIRVKIEMRTKGVKHVVGCSWIEIGNHVYTFKADQLQCDRGQEIYMILGLLFWEMETDSYIDNLTK